METDTCVMGQIETPYYSCKCPKQSEPTDVGSVPVVHLSMVVLQVNLGKVKLINSLPVFRTLGGHPPKDELVTSVPELRLLF